MSGNEASRGSVAMLISIADLFFGLAAIIMILIVLSSSTVERLVPEYLDMTLGCQMVEEDQVLVAEPGGVPLGLDLWLQKLSPDRLIRKIGVEIASGDLECFVAVDKAFRAHNLALDTDDIDQPVLSATLLLMAKSDADDGR